MSNEAIFPNEPLTAYTVPERAESEDYMEGYNDALHDCYVILEAGKKDLPEMVKTEAILSYMQSLLGHCVYPIPPFA